MCFFCVQFFLALAVFLLAVSAGMPIGYTPVVLPQLSQTDDPLQMDMDMYSWFGNDLGTYFTTLCPRVFTESSFNSSVSIHSLAAPLGAFLSGPLMDGYGRRFGCMLAVAPLVLGWIMIGSAGSHLVMLLGRMFAGFGVGLAAPPAQILLAECAEPAIRGVLVGVPIVAYSLGILITYTLGVFCSWRTVAWCSGIVPLISVGVALLVPESPTWLARHGRLERARAALLWLRCDEPTATAELQTIRDRFEREQKDTQAVATAERVGFWRLMTRPAILKPMTIIAVFNLLVLLAGTYLVIFYVADIIGELDANVNALHVAIVTAICRLIASLLCSVLVHELNRRTMLLGASVLAAFSCTALALFPHVRGDVVVRTAFDTYVPAVCLLLYIVGSTAFMMFPGIMVSELLPARERGRVSGLIFGIMHVVFFGTAKIFPYFAQVAKMDGVFMLFGVSSVLVTVFIYALMPETRGRTLGQIEDYFAMGKWLWARRPLEMRRQDDKKFGEVDA